MAMESAIANEHFSTSNYDRDGYKCTCDRGYKGDLCEQIDCSSNNCSENGVCLDNTFGPPSCDCSVGFTGRVCEINIDDCSTNPCGENGLCLDGVGNFICECAPGFSGHLCNEGIHTDS